MSPFTLTDVRFLPSLHWALRVATGKTPIEAYVRAMVNGIRAGKLAPGACS